MDHQNTFERVGDFRGFLKSWAMKNETTEVDLRKFLGDRKRALAGKIDQELVDLGALKVAATVRVTMIKGEDSITAYLRSEPLVVLVGSDPALDTPFEKLIESLAKWTHMGSGFTVENIENLYLDVAKYEPIRGGTFVELPPWIQKKKAIVNVKNKDNECFRWAVRSALYPAEVNPCRPSKYPRDDLNWNGVTFPMGLKKIAKFEEANSITINVYGARDKTIVPYRISEKTFDLVINLFYYQNHYSWIKHTSRLFFMCSKHKARKFFCERCLHAFVKEETLEKHRADCRGISNTACRIEMPTDPNLKFKDFKKQLPVPYVFYADFEALNVKFDEPKESGKTVKTGRHEVCSYGYIKVRYDGVTEPPKTYRGPDAVYKFLTAMQEEEGKIRECLRFIEPMRFTDDNKRDYWVATDCHICEKSLTKEGRLVKKVWNPNTGKFLGEVHKKCRFEKIFGPMNKCAKPDRSSRICLACGKKIHTKVSYVDKVRDHCHVTGNYRGAAHWDCNLNFSIKPDEIEIPVFFHNLRGYDSHLLMQAVSRLEGAITCIPNNMERYMSVSIGKLKFLDSMQFMPSSLGALVKLNDDFPILSEHAQHKEVLLRKGVFPYEYLDSWEKFEKELPPIEAFYSSLSDSNISEEDYEHAKKVWEVFQCEGLGDYHDVYLLSDVLQLADVFQNFRKMCQDYYGLDPAHFYTAPGLSWSALFKQTQAELELLTDYDQHLFIEKGIRGGICGASKRYARANNPLVPGYDALKPKNYIFYLDANNLYGWAMAQHLPMRDFKWSPIKDEEFYMQVAKDAKMGYVLEVDLEYPAFLHNLHNDYPLAPEAIEVPESWLSPWQKEVCPNYTPYKKLALTLRDKEKYVVHYRNLQFYLKHGMRLKKIHRVLQFTQEPWMEPYIMFNTKKRTAAKNDFEKNLFKLMNNSVFGKTMENIRKRVDVKLVRTEEEARKFVAEPGYSSHKILEGGLAAIHMHKSKLLLNKPVYVGFSVLELSKLLMYEFYYEHLKPLYGERCQLLYTDTDSLVLQIETEDVYRDVLDDLDKYDTSDYPKDHFLYSANNKKVLGKMKDEFAGKPIEEYVGLRPKMYSIKGLAKKAKGVKKYVVKKEITHESYLRVLNTKKEERHKMNALRSYGHDINNITQEKVSLSAFDSKRWICDDGINTLAFGHIMSNSSLTNPRLGPPRK